ncbi:UPF0481 protein At3g47200-like [Ziziphus jujuba]|uniref:UPF0481 protein At3g47200-like n=1 Tax=Ziziphus jujuba TaxID=326968 RepID=A0ABM4AD43_ZIZJJ|nr:UPF0481 protein At3g47200-like [Ziziphus jujuba]
MSIDMGEMKPCVIIDIPEELEPDLKETCRIQRVPRKLRQVNEAAYTPKLISIGPFHHGKPTLNVMEDHKTKYYHKFWERDFCKHIREKDIIRDFTGEVTNRRQRIRNIYAGTFDHVKDMKHFLEVILRDSCFIFELFLRNFENRLHDKKPEDITDYILRTPWLIKCIELDLIMLENQLPYFVFTELFDFILENQPENLNNIPSYLSKNQSESERHHFIMKMTCEFFREYYKMHGKASKSEGFIADSLEPGVIQRFKDIKHFTDLVRQFMHSNHDGASSENANCRYSSIEPNCRYSAIELDRAGVAFVPCSNKFLTDISFNKKGNMLEVRPFKVTDITGCLIRNVMALEQCLYPFEAHICNYIHLLDQLINTDEDVKLLVEKKVVDNWLGSNDAVAHLINTLGDEIVFSSHYYRDIRIQLNKVHGNFWNVTKATLKRVYFKDIWTGSSTIVAAVVVTFSIFSVASNIKDLFF